MAHLPMAENGELLCNGLAKLPNQTSHCTATVPDDQGTPGQSTTNTQRCRGCTHAPDGADGQGERLDVGPDNCVPNGLTRPFNQLAGCTPASHAARASLSQHENSNPCQANPGKCQRCA